MRPGFHHVYGALFTYRAGYSDEGNIQPHLLQEMGLDIPFLTVSGTIGEESAVDMMKAGAHDYLMKGNLARLAPAIERELAQSEVRRKRKQAEEALRESEEY